MLKGKSIMCKCRLRGERDETINHFMNECNKIAQKEYKARLSWKGDPLGIGEEIKI